MKNTCLVFTLFIIFFQGFAYAENSKIIFFSDRTGKQQIYMMKPDGSEQVRLISSTAIDVPGSCSPDGKKIVFESDRDGNFEIYVMNADGSGIKRLTNNPSDDGRPIWCK